MDGESYTVVLYARVSTDDKGQTNETQIRELKEDRARMGDVMADGGDCIYTDEQTAKNDKRPGFRELKGRISEGDVDYVVARNQDRISREPRDYQNFLEYCKQFRVRVRFSDNDSKPETAEGVILDSVQSGLAKADNIKRSVGTKKGMVTHKLNGTHVGRKLSFCFIEDLEEFYYPGIRKKDMIQTEGEHKTVLLNVDSVLDFARNGYSIPEASKMMGVSPMTLRRALKDKGIAGEYYRLLKKPLPQGMRTTRVTAGGENATTRDGESA